MAPQRQKRSGRTARAATAVEMVEAGGARVHYGRGPRWEFFSPRLRTPVRGSGDLLLDHLITVECSPDVASYEPFPSLSEKTVADSLVTYRNGKRVLYTLVESGDPIPTRDRRFSAERSWARAHACSHSVLQACEVRRSDKHLFNCYVLFPWLSELHQPSAEENRAVMGALVLEREPVTITDLAKGAQCDREIAVAVIARAYLQRIARIDGFDAMELTYASRVAAVRS